MRSKETSNEKIGYDKKIWFEWKVACKIYITNPKTEIEMFVSF